MEMPKSCGCCDLCLLSSDKQNFFCIRQLGKRFDLSLSGQRQEDCPLISVPEHGRLCDFDKFYTYIDYYICKNCEKSCSACDVPWIKEVISQAPTVLEGTT